MSYGTTSDPYELKDPWATSAPVYQADDASPRQSSYGQRAPIPPLVPPPPSSQYDNQPPQYQQQQQQQQLPQQQQRPQHGEGYSARDNRMHGGGGRLQGADALASVDPNAEQKAIMKDCQWNAIIGGAIPSSILATLSMFALKRVVPTLPNNAIPLGFATGYFGGYLATYYACFAEKAKSFGDEKRAMYTGGGQQQQSTGVADTDEQQSSSVQPTAAASGYDAMRARNRMTREQYAQNMYNNRQNTSGPINLYPDAQQQQQPPYPL